MRVARVLMIGLALLPGSVAAQEDQALAVLSEAETRYADVETLCADFVQTLSVPLLGTERRGTGRVCQGRPNLFGMRFDDPDGDLIVVDGLYAWVYFPSNDARTVLRTSADRAAGGRDFHREFLQDPASKYRVAYEGEETVEGNVMHRIRMQPRLPSSYRTAVVWIEAGRSVLRRVRLEEENGSVRTIALSGVVFDVDPGSGWFEFSPPDGVLVMAR